MVCCDGTRPAGTSGPTACVGAGAVPGDEAVAGICEEIVADGEVGETLVNPPHPASNNESAATAALGSVMAALQCKFRSPLNGPDWRPSWQPMTS
jgi:hypothetical protein